MPQPTGFRVDWFEDLSYVTLLKRSIDRGVVDAAPPVSNMEVLIEISLREPRRDVSAQHAVTDSRASSCALSRATVSRPSKLGKLRIREYRVYPHQPWGDPEIQKRK